MPFRTSETSYTVMDSHTTCHHRFIIPRFLSYHRYCISSLQKACITLIHEHKKSSRTWNSYTCSRNINCFFASILLLTSGKKWEVFAQFVEAKLCTFYYNLLMINTGVATKKFAQKWEAAIPKKSSNG